MSVSMPVCVGECLFLCIGVYLCYCVRSAPSFYFETKFIAFAIFNELLISTVYYVVRYVYVCVCDCRSANKSNSAFHPHGVDK